MKRTTYFLILMNIVTMNLLYASSIDSITAKNVAENFYRTHSRVSLLNLSVTYTEKTGTGEALYFVFNVNGDDGFVIVSADDAALPILGYSTVGHYVSANLPPNFTYWMQNYRKQIAYLKQQQIQASPEIKSKWQHNSNSIARISSINLIASTPTVGPLLSTTWSQSPYYNMLCPGGSQTGCVATAMAQTMKYWNYPARGTGVGSYCDCGYLQNYGTLSANFAATNYNWSDMPAILGSASSAKEDSSIAILMYDIGVSVHMIYNTSASGAFVTIADGAPVCAQTALVQYFGYDPKTLNGVQRSSFSDSIWVALLKNELDNKRPFLYAGVDATYGGHVWVCDGYQTDSLFHMNWGWGGYYNGYFAISALNPDGHNFTSNEEALIGIKPPFETQFTASPLVACSNATVKFTDQSTSMGTISGRKWLFPGGSPASSISQNPSVTYSSGGTYDVTEIITSTTGVDTLMKSAYIVVQSPTSLPLTEAFQETSFPPKGWYLNNPNNFNYTWQQNTSVGGYGKSSKCMYFDNCTPNQTVYGQRQQLYSPVYDFSSTANPKIWFDVAYAPYDKKSSDTLAVYYSVDCGKTFTLAYLKGGMSLGTAGDSLLGTSVNNIGGCFVPLDKNWRTDTIHLNALAGQSTVMFAFENRSGYGSDLYLDNIAIPLSVISTSVSEIVNGDVLKLYPNPTNDGLFTLSVQRSVAQSSALQLTDVLGKTILTQVLNSGQETFRFDLSGYPKGVYFARVITENGIWCDKLIRN